MAVHKSRIASPDIVGLSLKEDSVIRVSVTNSIGSTEKTQDKDVSLRDSFIQRGRRSIEGWRSAAPQLSRCCVDQYSVAPGRERLSPGAPSAGCAGSRGRRGASSSHIERGE